MDFLHILRCATSEQERELQNCRKIEKFLFHFYENYDMMYKVFNSLFFLQKIVKSLTQKEKERKTWQKKWYWLALAVRQSER